MTDMMEIARNSILQSGFEDDFKKKWLGENYKKGVTFCDEVRFSFYIHRQALLRCLLRAIRQLNALWLVTHCFPLKADHTCSPH
jgi:adenosine deaminase